MVMAKLSARGRVELVRLVKDEAEDDLTTRGKQYVALMSDRTILSKLVVWFKPTTYCGERRHDYGWKRRSKVKEGVTAEQFTAVYVKAGYRVE
jgi:hypothetical protein